MQSVSIVYYAAGKSKPHAATLHAIDPQSVMVKYQDGTLITDRYHSSQMTFIGAIGQRHPVIELDNDARIEFQSHEVPDWVPIHHQSFHHKVWKLERTPSLIIFSVVFVLALGFALIKWGVPTAAKVIAYQLPENTLTRVGHQAESYVMDYTKPSKLSQARQADIKAKYLSLVADNQPAILKFRAGDSLGANALALPNNTIIVTDELVELAKNDDEIIGVLAHEQGHLLKRHSLQQALSSLGFSVLYIAITGDSSDLLTTLPLAIVGAGYSRQFERESDLYALNLMHAKHIDTAHFANFLQRLSEEDEQEQKQEKKADRSASKDHTPDFGSVLNVLSSHPATAERVKMVRDFEASHPK